MGSTWGQQDPGGPHAGPMNLAIWVAISQSRNTLAKYPTMHDLVTDMYVHIAINGKDRT